MRFAAAIFSALLLLSSPVRGRAPERIVAIGDIHGELHIFRQLLRHTGLIDDADRWVGGSATLVQTGDFLDRGPDVRGVMDLLMELQARSAEAGGQVIVLLGNHEAMNLTFEYRDVGVEAYSSFVDEHSERRRDEAFSAWKTHVLRRAASLRIKVPGLGRAARKQWLNRHPPGLLEYREALGPTGEYGQWVRERPVVVRVGDSLFLHAGIGPESVDQDLAEINDEVREEIAILDRHRSYLLERKLILPFSDRTEIWTAAKQEVELRQARGTRDAPETRHLHEIASQFGSLTRDSALLRGDGPLWYRGYALEPEPNIRQLIESTLERNRARRVVAGHSTLASATIPARLDGRIFLIDTGMLSSYYPGGRGSALEIDGDSVTAVYEDGERIALVEPDEPAVEAALARWLGPDGAALPFRDEVELLAFLHSAKVTQAEEFGEGVTRPERLVLESGGVRVRAIFHDVHIETMGGTRHGRSFVSSFRDSYLSQAAAYEVSRLLGLDSVPPTVVRQVGDREGSVALWIEEAINERRRRELDIRPPDLARWVRSFHDMRIFDNLINNIDRNEGNILLDSAWKLWMIDHTRAFASSSQLPDRESVKRCSRSLLEALRGLEEEEIQNRLSPYLSKVGIRAMLKRRNRLLELIDDRIRELGESAVLFDYKARPLSEVLGSSQVGSPGTPG